MPLGSSEPPIPALHKGIIVSPSEGFVARTHEVTHVQSPDMLGAAAVWVFSLVVPCKNQAPGVKPRLESCPGN